MTANIRVTANNRARQFRGRTNRGAGFASGGAWSEMVYGEVLIPRGKPGWLNDSAVDKALGSAMTNETKRDRSLAPVVEHLRRLRHVPPALRVLAHWIGTVSDVREDTFIARVRDPEGVLPDHEAEFPLDVVSPYDKDLLEEGNSFYWTLGFRDTAIGRPGQVSTLAFRRVPRWTRADIAAGQRWLQQFSELFEIAEEELDKGAAPDQ